MDSFTAADRLQLVYTITHAIGGTLASASTHGYQGGKYACFAFNRYKWRAKAV